MKRIKLLFAADADDLNVPDYEREDCERIVAVFAHVAVACTVEQAHAIWSKYSDGLFAGWMTVPSDDVELFNALELTQALAQMPPPEQWPPSLLKSYAIEEAP